MFTLGYDGKLPNRTNPELTMISIRRIALPAFAFPVAALALAVPVLADNHEATATPGTMDTARISGGTYQADPYHTLVSWRLNHMGFNDYFGIFGDINGTLELDPADIASAKLDLTIPVSKITVASGELKDHLFRAGEEGKNPDFFGSAPDDAHFVTTIVRQTGPNEALVTGSLTLNGVTRPVAIAARFTGVGPNPMTKKETVGFEGHAMLNRSEFGLGFGVPMVSDSVRLEITAAFEKQ
jgi:polyisoprenoid-binding protein YceI